MAAKKTVRAIIGVVVALVVIVVVALAALPSLLNVEQYHDKIQTQLQKSLNRPVSLGHMELKTFPLRIRVQNVNIGDDPQFSSASFATANELDGSVKLLPLLSKNVEIDSLELLNPKVQLVHNPQGVWNFSTIGGTSEKKPGSKDQSQLSVSHLKLSDGSVTVLDSFQHATTTNTYDHIDLDVKNFAPNRRFGLTLSAHLPGQGNQTVSLDGNMGPVNDKNFAATPVDAKLTLNSVQLSALQQFLQSDALKGTSGVATGDVHLKNDNGNFAADGNLKLSDAHLHGVDLGYPVSADFNVKGDLTADQYDISKMNVKLGATPVSVAGTINAKPNPALADLHITSGNESLAEIARLASAFGVGLAPGLKVDGKLNADITAKGPIDKPALNGILQLANVQASGGQLKQPVSVPSLKLTFSPTLLRADPFSVQSADLRFNSSFALNDYSGSAPHLQFSLDADHLNVAELQALTSSPQSTQPQAQAQPKAGGKSGSGIDNWTGGGQVNIGQLQYQDITLNNVRATVALDRGVIRLAPVTSELFNGTESGTITIDTRPAQPVITANLQTQKVDANKLLSTTTSIKQQLYGLLNAGGNLSFSPVPNGNLASTLNGTLNMNLLNGKITGIDLLRELGSIAKFGAGGNGVTNLTQLSGNFDIRNGLAHTNNLKAAIDGGTLAGIGDINLATQQLNMKVTAVLTNAMSKSVGGTGIGGYLNTALANNSGELVIPVIVTGSFQSPHFQPDVEQLAQMKLKNLLPTTSNPAGALGGFLGGGGAKGGLSGLLGALGGQQQQQQGAQPQNQQQPTSQQDAINGLLNQLGGRKKPK